MTGWDSIGASRDTGNGGSDIVKIDGTQKRLRLVLPPTGPINSWSYALSAPDDGYRTWVAPAKTEDFFAINSAAFRLRAVHAALAYDYDEQKVLILEQGTQIWEGIKTLHGAGKDLNGRDIIINKKGTGRSTEYTVVDADPTPFEVDLSNAPDINARYVAPTKEQVIEDLRAMGFTAPEQLFETSPLAYEVAVATKVPFGKYKDKTMQDVFNIDSQYLNFLSTKIDRADIKEAARVVCNQLMGTAYELNGIAPTVDQVPFTAPTQGTAAPTGAPAGRPTDPNFIHDNGDGTELWFINGAWSAPQPKQQEAPLAPPAPAAGPQRPTDPAHIHNDGTRELWWINNEWVPSQ